MSIFPTDKLHISYSEVKTWRECPWRHKLIYIDKILPQEESPHLDYGTIIHESIENYLKSKIMDFNKVENDIRNAWKEKGFDSAEYIQKQKDYRRSQGWKPKKHDDVDVWVKWAKISLSDISKFLDENFNDWELLSAEELLYENIKNDELKFKGYIDCVLKTKNKGKDIIWILDWKTSSSRGWDSNKRRNFLTQAQIGLYKSFWAEKNNIDLKNIRCGFVLLKKGARPGRSCELIPVSVGPKFIGKSNKLIQNMVKSVRRGFYLKNRDSCLFCPFHKTENCK